MADLILFCMFPSTHRLRFCTTLLALILVACHGCVAIPLAAAGTMLGAAGSAASAGSAVYNLGKLDFSEMATLTDCHSAALAASDDLQTRVRRCAVSGKPADHCEIDLEDDQKSIIEILIDQRAGHLCQCRIDVGLFGSEPTAKLVMERMQRHLPPSADSAGGR